MEIEPSNSPHIISKKIHSIFRIILMMVKKGISKSKLIMDLNFLFKRGNKLANQAINGLIIYHNSLICKPNNSPNHHHFISPKEYEFSCSNSPELGPFHLMMAQHKKARPKHGGSVQRVLEMFNTHEGAGPMASPSSVGIAGQGQYALPGFGNGKSPLVRQLRVTDSPFPLKYGKGDKEEEEEKVKVNKAADEFIKRFYDSLKMQRHLESPNYHMWAR